jgi:hypothetical protein
MRRPRGGFEHRGDAHRPQATGTCTRRSRSAAEGGMPRGRGEARLHPNVRNRQTPRRAAWSVTAVHARPLDAPAPGPWSTAPSPTIERIGGRASPPSAHRMTVTHRQAALSGATVTPPEGWSDSAFEPTVRNQSRQQPRTSYAHGGTAAYLLDRQAKNWTYDLLRREPVLHCLSPTASDFDRQGFPDWMQDVINRASGRVKREYVKQTSNVVWSPPRMARVG